MPPGSASFNLSLVPGDDWSIPTYYNVRNGFGRAARNNIDQLHNELILETTQHLTRSRREKCPTMRLG